MPAGTKGTIFTVFSTAYAVGKTLIAVNIAAELARDGFKVLLSRFRSPVWRYPLLSEA